MKSLIVAAAASGTFTLYPGPESPDLRIEAITQRGPIYELIVACDTGTAILTYSPVDRRYCSPRFVCSESRAAIIAKSCGGASGAK